MFYQKLFRPFTICYSDREKLLKFEAESQEFAKFAKHFLTVGQNNFDLYQS